MFLKLKWMLWVFRWAFRTIFVEGADPQALVELDPLTDVYDRQTITMIGRREAARAKRSKEWLTVCFLDIDGFKKINDILGYSAGDGILQQVGAITRVLLRRESDCIGRWGGDEFVLIFPMTDERGASNLLGWLQQQLSAIKVSVGSCSVCFDTGSDISFEKMVALAQSAMQAEKRQKHYLAR